MLRAACGKCRPSQRTRGRSSNRNGRAARDDARSGRPGRGPDEIASEDRQVVIDSRQQPRTAVIPELEIGAGRHRRPRRAAPLPRAWPWKFDFHTTVGRPGQRDMASRIVGRWIVGSPPTHWILRMPRAHALADDGVEPGAGEFLPTGRIERIFLADAEHATEVAAGQVKQVGRESGRVLRRTRCDA